MTEGEEAALEDAHLLQWRMVDWVQYEAPDDDPTFWTIAPGEIPPVWFWNALVNVDLVPWPEPEIGEQDWGRDVKVVSTGKVFPIGSIISRGDLSSLPQP